MMLSASSLISLICPIVAMTFFTLLELKVIGYMQTRVGPNKVALIGILQPLLDAAKLLTKENIFLKKSNRMLHILFPFMGLFLALSMWILFPNQSFNLPFSMALFLCISSLSVYPIWGAGWSSNSKYATLGSTRAVAQTISYEVSLALILMGALMLFFTWELENVVYMKTLMISPLIMIWFLSCLAETNRAPFDFVEGESEIVSGFNIEYSSFGFVLIFMAEYLNMMFLSFLSYLIFFSHTVNMILGSVLFCFMYLWARASLPRMRYDRLMNICWKTFLPIALLTLLLSPPIILL